jgi:hypothetical protein
MMETGKSDEIKSDEISSSIELIKRGSHRWVALACEDGNEMFTIKTVDPDWLTFHRTWNAKYLRGKNIPPLTGKITNVRNLWEILNNLPKLEKIYRGHSVEIFAEGVTSTWEDPANIGGGRLMFTISNRKDSVPGASDMWTSIVLELIGETLDPKEIVSGLILADKRGQGYGYRRVSIWVKGIASDDDVLELAQRIKVTIGDCRLDYQKHGTSHDDYVFTM